MAGPPAGVLIDSITFLCPPYKGEHGLTEVFPVFSQGILNSWRDLRERFPGDQVFFPGDLLTHR